ncbi:MAG: hypothetical protein GY856_08855 [bacterium]|nr:hypothetical protein [bacterium]
MTQPRTTVTSPEELLDALRALKRQLFSNDVVAAIKQQSSEERTAFVDRRMELSTAITRLETAQVRAVRVRVEELGVELNAGIDGLSESLKEIEKAAQWSQGLGRVLSSVGKIVAIA